MSRNLALFTSDVNNKLRLLLQTNFLGRGKPNKKRTYVIKLFLNRLFLIDELLALLNSVEAIVSTRRTRPIAIVIGTIAQVFMTHFRPHATR